MSNVPHKIARDVQFRRYLYLPGVCILIARIFAIAQQISRGAMEDATESQVSETAPASLTSLHVYGEHAAPLYEVPPVLHRYFAALLRRAAAARAPGALRVPSRGKS